MESRLSVAVTPLTAGESSRRENYEGEVSGPALGERRGVSRVLVDRVRAEGRGRRVGPGGLRACGASGPREPRHPSQAPLCLGLSLDRSGGLDLGGPEAGLGQWRK